MIDFCLTHKNINRFPVLEDEYAFSRAISLDFPNKLFTLAPSLSLALSLFLFSLTLSSLCSLSLFLPLSVSVSLCVSFLMWWREIALRLAMALAGGCSTQEVAGKKLIPMPKPPSGPSLILCLCPRPPSPIRVRVRVHVTTAAKQLMLCQKTRKWTLCLADCVLALTNATVSLFLFPPYLPLSLYLQKSESAHSVHVLYKAVVITVQVHLSTWWIDAISVLQNSFVTFQGTFKMFHISDFYGK